MADADAHFASHHDDDDDDGDGDDDILTYVKGPEIRIRIKQKQRSTWISDDFLKSVLEVLIYHYNVF